MTVEQTKMHVDAQRTVGRAPSHQRACGFDYRQAATAELVSHARAGDDLAWTAIVDRFQGLLWSVAAGFRFDTAVRQDLAQGVWLKLLDNLDRIREPERLGAWLAITAKRHAIDIQRKRGRIVPIGDAIEDVVPEAWTDAHAVEGESDRAAVLRAFASLPEDMQCLLRLLVVEPRLSYREISELADRPVGSIGPSRARALERLRRAFLAEVGGFAP